MLKLINKYSKMGNLKYISHLDVLRFIQRAVKRAGVNAKYSEGFNPHMKTSFGFPLSLGTESIGEYFEIELNEDISPLDFQEKINAVMPKEMQIIKSAVSTDDKSIMSRCAYAQYIITIESESLNMDRLNQLLTEILEGVTITREKKNKKNKMVTKELNTGEYIKYLKAEMVSDNKAKIQATFITAETGSMKVDELLKIINEKAFSIDYNTIMKIDALDENMEPIL